MFSGCHVQVIRETLLLAASMFADGQVPTSSRNLLVRGEGGASSPLVNTSKPWNLDIQCFAGIFLNHDYSFFSMKREVIVSVGRWNQRAMPLEFAKLEPSSISEQYGDFVTEFLEFLSCSKTPTR
jgi:hypothetical protein